MWNIKSHSGCPSHGVVLPHQWQGFGWLLNLESWTVNREAFILFLLFCNLLFSIFLCTGEPVRHRNKPHIVRYKLWDYYERTRFDWYPEGGFPKCHGIYQRWICIFSLHDLPSLTTSEKMFANKFSKKYEPSVYDCLETWHLNKLKMEKQGHRVFNTSYYETLDFVENHIK